MTFFDYAERRHGRRGRDVQRPRRLPQDARGHDVPVVHGDARRAALDARPRQRAAPDDRRTPRRSGPRRRGRVRSARSVSRVPRVQGRMPGRRGRGALQERVPRRLLAAARHAARGARARQRARRSREWGSRFAPLSNWVAGQRAGATSQRAAARHRPAARGCPQFERRTLRRARATRSRRAAGRRCSSTTPSRITTTRRSGSPRSTCCGGGRATGARAESLLRAAADFKGSARRSARAMAERNTEALYADAAAGRPIVFCEPSCLSAVREDAPALLRGESASQGRDGRRRVACSSKSSPHGSWNASR